MAQPQPPSVQGVGATRLRLLALCFVLAFVSIGVEFAPGAIREMGWKPVAVYLGATVFNTVLALLAASVIFGALGGG